MKKKITFLLLFFCLKLFSQISENYRPIFHSDILLSIDDYELVANSSIEKRTIDLNQYDDFNGLTVSSKKLPSDNSLKEDILNIQKKNPNIYGKRIDFNIDFIGNATKYRRDDHYIYLYKITTSVESEASQFIFSEFNLSENAKFYIYNDLHDNILGAYTKKSYHNSKSFTTQPINGDYIILELDVPVKEDEEQQNQIKLSNIISIPFSNFSGGKSGDCNDNMDVNSTLCNKSDFLTKNSIKSVGLMLLPVYAGNKKYNAYCSGVLLNNTNEDKTPYFLTARHCANPFELKHSNWKEELIVMFNHEKSKDKRVDINNNNNTILGADILFDGGNTSDAVLLKLRAENHVLENYRVGFAGWDASFKSDPRGNYYGVSHPKGDYKKTTEFRNVVHASSAYGPYGRYLKLDNRSPIIHASWRRGIVEDGSSGSPLFNKNKVIGILSFGPKYNVNEFGYPDTKAPFEYCKAPMLFNSDLNNDRTHTFNLYTAGYVSFSSIFNNISSYLAPNSTRKYIDSLPFNTCNDITIGPVIDSGSNNNTTPGEFISNEHKLRRSENIFVEDPIETFGTYIDLEKEGKNKTSRLKIFHDNDETIVFTNQGRNYINFLSIKDDKTIRKDSIMLFLDNESHVEVYARPVSLFNNNLLLFVSRWKRAEGFKQEYRNYKFDNSTKKWVYTKSISINGQTTNFKPLQKGRFIANTNNKSYLFELINDNWVQKETNYFSIVVNNYPAYSNFIQLDSKKFLLYISRKGVKELILYSLNSNGLFIKNSKIDSNLHYENQTFNLNGIKFLGSGKNIYSFSSQEGDLIVAKLENYSFKIINVIKKLPYLGSARHFDNFIITQSKNGFSFIKSENNYLDYTISTIKKTTASGVNYTYFFTNNYALTTNKDYYNKYLKYLNVKEVEYLTDDRLQNNNNLTQVGNYHITSLDLPNYLTDNFYKHYRVRTNTKEALVYFNGGHGENVFVTSPVHTLIIGDLTYDKYTTYASFIFYAKNQIILKPGFHSKPANSNINYVNMHFSVLQKNDNPENTFTFNQVNNPIYDPQTYKFARKVEEFIDVYGKNYYNNESLSSNEVFDSNKNILNVFPNPSSNYIYVKSVLNINDWNIYDINARIVLRGNNKNENSLKINLNSLPPGIYFFKFYDSLGILHDRKIIKK